MAAINKKDQQTLLEKKTKYSKETEAVAHVTAKESSRTAGDGCGASGGGRRGTNSRSCHANSLACKSAKQRHNARDGSATARDGGGARPPAARSHGARLLAAAGQARPTPARRRRKPRLPAPPAAKTVRPRAPP